MNAPKEISKDDRRQVLIARLKKRVEVQPNGCWYWIGATNKGGYGVIQVDRKPVSTHRMAFDLFVGPIPKGLFVCHKCDVRKCVNPDHLFIGTHADNTADMVNKGRSAHGERSNHVKLTEADVLEIRKMYADGGILQSELAKRFGVSHSLVVKIILGKLWKRSFVPGGKTRDSYGERHHSAKLTEASVLEIRKIYSEGKLTQEKIAKRYGVDRSVVGSIVLGKIWKHLPTNVANE